MGSQDVPRRSDLLRGDEDDDAQACQNDNASECKEPWRQEQFLELFDLPNGLLFGTVQGDNNGTHLCGDEQSKRQSVTRCTYDT